MRNSLLFIPLLIVASPALAQSGGRSDSGEPELVRVPHELTDPAAVDRLALKLEALSQALLNVQVGELKAAAEGHAASPAERRMTVGDVIRRHDPDFDRKVARQVAEAGPKVRQSLRAVHDALPAMVHAINEAQQAVDRVTANMPDPTYPTR